MDWLLAPIDPDRAHAVGLIISLHGRVMTLAWVIIAPLAVVIARYLKVTPRQDWPRQLDNKFWWYAHYWGQMSVFWLSMIGLGLILTVAAGGTTHGRLGIMLLGLLLAQVGLGLRRGRKGGPTSADGNPRGDHYDMTPWRVFFEYAHKSLGYLLILLSVGVVLLGLWQANAPRWMWAMIALWWAVLICGAAIAQTRGMAIDTYQAIWGPDPKHPGNHRKPIGFGIRQITARSESDKLT